METLESRLVPSTVDALRRAPVEVIQQRLDELPAAPAFTGGRTRFERDRAHFRFDRRGIIMTWVRPAQRYVYLPTSVARYVMALYNGWRQGDDSALRPLRTNALWLAVNGRPRRSGPHRFLVHPIPVGELDFGITAYRGTSALTAGHSMVALHMAGLALNNTTLLRMARQILPGFAANIQQGGYRMQLGPRAAWFEEYAQPGVKPPFVLNGHIWAVLDLLWYAKQTNDPDARKLAVFGISGLRKTVAQFTDSPISAYDLRLRGQICGYHYADINLLRAVYRLTNIDTFRKHADTWAQQRCSGP